LNIGAAAAGAALGTAVRTAAGTAAEAQRTQGARVAEKKRTRFAADVARTPAGVRRVLLNLLCAFASLY